MFPTASLLTHVCATNHLSPAPSHSTSSASHLRQYKDRQKKFVVEIEPVPRVFEKLNGLAKTLSREFTGQHTGSL
jgi:hypothetical protein